MVGQKIKEEVVWDKKKIVMLLSTLVLIFGGIITAKNFFFPNSSKGIVAGIHTLNSSAADSASANGDSNTSGNETANKSFFLPTSQDIQQKVQDIQKQIMHLNIDEIASSSPQIKQVIEQIQSLPAQPANIARTACEQLCKNIK